MGLGLGLGLGLGVGVGVCAAAVPVAVHSQALCAWMVQVSERFEKEVDAALSNKYKRFDNAIHILKHA